MRPMSAFLRNQGHQVFRFGYRWHIDLNDAARELSSFLTHKGLLGEGDDLGFVGHSAGGVLLRYLALALPEFHAGRSVALGSPLTGSIIAQHFSKRWYMRAIYGQTLASLHPDVVSSLPPPPCLLASIAGSRHNRLLPASFFLRATQALQDQGSPAPTCDSTVLARETKLATNSAHITVDVTHTSLPTSPLVHSLVAHYLRTGTFPTPNS